MKPKSSLCTSPTARGAFARQSFAASGFGLPKLGSLLLLCTGLLACQNSSDQQVWHEEPEPIKARPLKLEPKPIPSEPELAMAADQAMLTQQARNKLRHLPQAQPLVYQFEPEPLHIEWSGQHENYYSQSDNPIQSTMRQPLSTFAVDVDTSSYANVRRMVLQEGRRPPAAAVRTEEMINYFQYRYPKPNAEQTPFYIDSELSRSPWNPNKHLLRIGLQGYEADRKQRPPANLVFLVDVSGSMQARNKLPLLKQSLHLLLKELGAEDTVALVTYAGAAKVVLPATRADEKNKIRAAINGLTAGGGTHGSAGIQLAYQQAQQGFIRAGINRVIIASDGDMNIGITNIARLKNLIAQKRQSGIALSTLGFGVGNYNDALMEQLADVGNGNAAYIDNLKEAHKVLVQQMNATLHTIASDVKIQVEFNPAQVSEYRLVGYENRQLSAEDFNNDKVDAGEIGQGHQVTAIYELSLQGEGSLPALRYGNHSMTQSQALTKKRPATYNNELAYIKLRYKSKADGPSQLLEKIVRRAKVDTPFEQASGEHRFAVSVAELGQRLRGAKHITQGNLQTLLAQLDASKGQDPFAYRGELINMVALIASIEE